MNLQLVLPSDLRGVFNQTAADWQASSTLDRFWRKDASLWTGGGEEKWLGWINIVERQQAARASFAALTADVKQTGFKHLVLLGMGGSSLCPEVLAVTFGQQAGFPKLAIVDSTDPVQVKSVRDSVNLAETLVVVASKSGSTLEPNVLKQYFFEEMQKAVGADKAGSHFIAITDPGSKMEQVAKGDGFRQIFYGDPEIGGRFSALSNFGVVAATAAGLDIDKLLGAAAGAVAAAKKPVAENPAAQLGLLLGVAANSGRDKLTVFA
jgi:glucose-6-phosphate isomerase